MKQFAIMDGDMFFQMEKIKTPFAKMIIDGSREKPYFSILYFDPADKDFHIGYSSYYLDYVFNWLNENFEIVEDGNFALSVLRPVSRERVEKVWRGEWKHYLPPLGAGDVQCRCTRCGRTPDVETPFCAWCGAPMTDEAVDMVMERLEALHDTGN